MVTMWSGLMKTVSPSEFLRLTKCFINVNFKLDFARIQIISEPPPFAVNFELDTLILQAVRLLLNNQTMAKYIIKKTGEIVDVVSYSETGSYVEYYDSRGIFIHDENANIYKDFDAIIGGKEPIDWEQRRYEIAKDVLASELIVDATNGIGNTDADDVVWRSVFYADKLIKELKKK